MLSGEAYPELLHYFDDGGEKPAKKMKYDLKYDDKGEISNYWNMRTPYTNMFVDNLVYNSDPSIFVIVESNPRESTERGYYSVFNFQRWMV